MFSPIIRLTLFITIIGAAIISFIKGKDFGGVALILGAVYVAVDYYRSGSVWVAFRHLRKGRFDLAQKHIKQTKYTKWLRNTHKSSYHTIEGYLALQNNHLDKASKSFAKAEEFGFRSPRDRAMNFINQINVLVKLGKKTSAKKKFLELKELNTSGFEEEIRKLNQLFNN